MYKLKIAFTWLLSIVVSVLLTMQICSFKLEYYRPEGQPFFQDGILWVLILGAMTGLSIYAIFKLAVQSVFQTTGPAVKDDDLIMEPNLSGASVRRK